MNENEFELIYYYRMGDEKAQQYLVDKFTNMIWNIIHSFDLTYFESDRDDLFQICLEELFKSLNRYNDLRLATFRTYFYRCAKTKILNYLERESNKTYYQIKSAISLDDVVCEDGEKYISEVITIPNMFDPLLRIDLNHIERLVCPKLSIRDQKIWELKKLEFTYEEIALQCNVSRKTVDNVIRKVQKLIKEKVY